MEITLSLLLWRIGGIVRNRWLPCITVAVFDLWSRPGSTVELGGWLSSRLAQGAAGSSLRDGRQLRVQARAHSADTVNGEPGCHAMQPDAQPARLGIGLGMALVTV